ncbi:uncharacterized protein RSE6_13786 [Rhynchosporium secalis]|uniref:Peptidase S53 domain-containing protein n=1 Tax=Rhynchosporium secalis TaxID=38038 RepID=A0A1E1MTR3_RHYSE|nr:uncharacterized protein RSE6_13786 [Rhynchosporium secalis]
MDPQLVGGLTYPTPSTYFSTGGRAPVRNGEQAENEPFLEFLTYLLAMEKIPQTISIGYADKEWTVPPSYAYTVCDLFAQLTARGDTILFPSGDSGSGRNCSVINANKLSYTPLFPASCPWVTTVGGTQAVGPEKASFTSGGGFSNYFPRPSWQDAAVSSWLSIKADPAFTQRRGSWNLPREELINGGGGAATATFASVVALLNSDCISNGLPPFGFLNPWPYSVGKSGLNDILSGTSGGCKEIPSSGFTAVAGWDPITGLGTPDFEKLRLASTGISSLMPLASRYNGIIRHRSGAGFRSRDCLAMTYDLSSKELEKEVLKSVNGLAPIKQELKIFMSTFERLTDYMLDYTHNKVNPVSSY